METVTGKNKEKFEDWYRKLVRSKDHRAVRTDNTYIDLFNEWFFEMQIGVYLAYYDSLEYDVTVFKFLTTYEWSVFSNKSINKGKCETRNEAYREAFKRANQIINEKEKV